MKKILCFLLLLSSFALYAQKVTVHGVVTNGYGEAIVGANVSIKGTRSGTATLDGGKYTLSAKVGQTVVCSFVGYFTEEFVIEGEVLNITLFEDALQLEEAVVTVGYGAMKKSDLTGSIASVKADKLKSVAIVNADQMLQGTVAGVQVSTNSGAPGGATSIRIRGASSINNSNEPLYVVDGIPFSGSGTDISGFDWAGGSNGQTKVNPLSTIAPQDIVSIDVLKDASATAIYGAAGANGVVIINTRRGREGKMTLSYDGQVAAQTLANKIDMMDLPEYAQYKIEMNKLYPGSPIDDILRDPSLLGPGTDWQDAIFRTALMHSHALSLTGGTEKAKYAASVGYMNQDGTIYGSNFERYNGRFNVDGTVTNWLKAGGSLAFTRTDETITRQDGSDGVIMQALTMTPSIPIYNFDGSYAGPTTVYGSSSMNPLWQAEMQNNTLLRNRVMGNFYLQLDPVKGLNIRSEFGYDVQNSTNKSFIPTYDFGNGIANDLNQMRQSESQNLFWIWKTFATYNETFGKHSVNAMAGWELQQSQWEGIWLQKSGFSTDDIHVMTDDGTFGSNGGYKDGTAKASAFARLNYNYGDRYLLTGTVRADASSKFGPNNKWGYFPSGAFAWKVSNEEWMKGASNWLSELKLRLGYGMVGNDNIATYQYGSTMTSANISMGGTSYRVSNISNPNLKWEASEQFNLGLDFGVFDKRLSVTLDVYKKTTKDLLMQISVPGYLGVGANNGTNIGAPVVNIGATENKGFDIALYSYPVLTNDFSWSSNLNFSKNVNTVVSLNDDSQVITGGVKTWFGAHFTNASRIEVGKPMGIFYGYVTDGYFKNKEDVMSHAVQVEDPKNPGQNLYSAGTGVYVGDIKFKDINKDGVINDEDQTIIGDPNPDFTFGWQNTFTYKSFDLGINLSGVIGGDILNISRYRIESLNNQWDNLSGNVRDMAIVGKDENGDAYLVNAGTAKTPRVALNDFNTNNRMSDRWLEDGSFVRIQNITLGYTLDPRFAQNMGLTKLKVYVTCQNAYTFTKYSGYDPEIGAFNQSAIMQNYDMGRYPTPRMFILGLNIGF